MREEKRGAREWVGFCLAGCETKERTATRTEVFDNTEVKGSEFLRRVKVIARRRGLKYEWAPERGVGSHGTLYLGDRFTVVKDLKKELGPGLLAAMCKQLDIRRGDI